MILFRQNKFPQRGAWEFSAILQQKLPYKKQVFLVQKHYFRHFLIYILSFWPILNPIFIFNRS